MKASAKLINENRLLGKTMTQVNMKVYPLYLGDMYADSNYTIMGDTAADANHPHEPHRLLNTPSSAFLIDHPEVGWILFDTGVPDDPWTAWPKFMVDAQKIEKPEDHRMLNQLAKVGVKPEDIKYVVSSHLHMDHVGNDDLFAKTAHFIISRADAQHAYCMVLGTMDENERGWYIKQEVLRDRKEVTYLDHDTEDLFPGIDAFILPGHTPGVLTLLLHLEGQDMFLASDAIPCQRNYDGMLPGGAFDTVGCRNSIAKVHELCNKYNAQVFFGHDYEQFAQIKKAPEYYE